MTDQYFRPRNWARFQRYKRKRPPWIRLHTKRLMEPDYRNLTLIQRAVLTDIYILFAVVGRPLPLCSSYLGQALGCSCNAVGKALPHLLSSNFIELCEKDEQIMTPETETETETERKKKHSPPPASADVIPIKTDKKIPDQMVQIWNEVVRSPPVKVLSEPRRLALLARYHDELGNDLQAWRIYCQHIKGNAFLQGGGERGWRANLDWAIKPANLIKIMEGNYGQDRDEAARNLRDNINRAFDDDGE